MLSPKRTLSPVVPSSYAGRDFPDLAVDADDLFAIDLGAALAPGDALIASSLAVIFYPVVGSVPNFLGALDGGPGLVGTFAAQAIRSPAAARYLLGFTCDTAGGRTIALYSFFNAVVLPHATT
jgi:hypothetical protein